MTARVTINLMKWESCKAIGESPKAFIERMTSNIEAIRANGLKWMYEEYEKSKSEWRKGQIEYEERKLKRYEKEIAKALKEL